MRLDGISGSQPLAVEQRQASALLPQEPITRHAADTILTHRATRALVAVIVRSATAAALITTAEDYRQARPCLAGAVERCLHPRQLGSLANQQIARSKLRQLALLAQSFKLPECSP